MEESGTTPVEVTLPEGVEVESHETQDEWLKARKAQLGASEAAAILGLSRFKTPVQLFYEKTGLADRSPAESEAAYWGLLLEEPIAKRYAVETQRPVEDPGPYTIMKRPALPLLAATLDRLTLVDGIWIPLELKTAHASLSKNWQDEPPLEYVVQVQAEMMVWGSDRASLAGLIGGQQFVWLDIMADREFQEMLYQEIQAFYRRIETGEVPPMDGTPGTRDLLKKLYAGEGGEVISLPPAAMEWDSEIVRLKEEIKQLNEELTRHENEMIQAIGFAAAGVLPDGTVWTHKTQRRKEYTVQASEYKVLRRAGAKGHR